MGRCAAGLIAILLSLTSCRTTGAPPAPTPVNIAAARRSLGRCLATMGHQEWPLDALHGGACPAFRTFAGEFLEAAGPELIPIVTSLMAECASGEARYLLVCVLGESRSAKALPLLKSLLPVIRPFTEAEAALYSIGMIRSKEGLEFLIHWLTTTTESEAIRGTHLGAPALEAIGLHGAMSLDFMLGEARRNQAAFGFMKEHILDMVRGEDAVEALRRLYETDEDEGIRRGAALALGWSVKPSTLEYWSTRADYEGAALALLAPLRVPDIWNATVRHRKEIAERILAAVEKTPTDPDRLLDLARLASLASPVKARRVFEAMLAGFLDPESYQDAWVQATVGAFADQPDLDLPSLRKLSRLPPHDFRRFVEWGALAAPLSGKSIGGSRIIRDVLDSALKPDPNDVEGWLDSGSLRAVMRSGISEASLSETLKEAWRRAPSLEAKQAILTAVLQGASLDHPEQYCSLTWTQPDSFLISVICDDPEPGLRLTAAASYFYAGCPAEPDPGALRAATDLLARTDWKDAYEKFEDDDVGWNLIKLIAAHHARYGKPADIPRLKALPETFVYPENFNYRENMVWMLNWAIDAIRLRSN